MSARTHPRVLVVESDPALTASLATAFEDTGFEAHAALNGLDAVFHIARAVPEVVAHTQTVLERSLP